eukprot:scaffold68311_cov59-Phaeocystis_antarctica.AAC.2
MHRRGARRGGPGGGRGRTWVDVVASLMRVHPAAVLFERSTGGTAARVCAAAVRSLSKSETAPCLAIPHRGGRLRAQARRRVPRQRGRQPGRRRPDRRSCTRRSNTTST